MRRSLSHPCALAGELHARAARLPSTTATLPTNRLLILSASSRAYWGVDPSASAHVVRGQFSNPSFVFSDLDRLALLLFAGDPRRRQKAYDALTAKGLRATEEAEERGSGPPGGTAFHRTKGESDRSSSSSAFRLQTRLLRRCTGSPLRSIAPRAAGEPSRS